MRLTDQKKFQMRTFFFVISNLHLLKYSENTYCQVNFIILRTLCRFFYVFPVKKFINKKFYVKIKV